MRLIDADKLDWWYKGRPIRRVIDEAPTVDAVEVVHGRWVSECEPDGTPCCFHCSVCDPDFCRMDIKTQFSYCPFCGAKMDGDKNA